MWLWQQLSVTSIHAFLVELRALIRCAQCQITPWSRVLPEKLKRPELLKKFPVFYGTRRFITAFTRARHLSLSRARLIQSMPPHPTSRRSILIVSFHLRLGLPSGLLPSGFPTIYIQCGKILWTGVRYFVCAYKPITCNSQCVCHTGVWTKIMWWQTFWHGEADGKCVAVHLHGAWGSIVVKALRY
jgi:hypothetical protein